jgi:putative sigma-54 modulation protein
VHIEISTRRGTLGPAEQKHLQEKAEKLLKYFGRLMSIELAVEQKKNGWQVEILASAEHKHDFVAVELGETPESAMDLCVQKMEAQLRRYKERVQGHRAATPHGGTTPESPDLPEPPTST